MLCSVRRLPCGALLCPAVPCGITQRELEYVHARKALKQLEAEISGDAEREYLSTREYIAQVEAEHR